MTDQKPDTWEKQAEHFLIRFKQEHPASIEFEVWEVTGRSENNDPLFGQDFDPLPKEKDRLCVGHLRFDETLHLTFVDGGYLCLGGRQDVYTIFNILMTIYDEGHRMPSWTEE